jgi:hypothetical protein
MTIALATDRHVPADRALPHLAHLFDVQAMTRSLAAQWSMASSPQSAPRVLGCDIERVKYRPGRNCVVGYRVRLQLPSRRGGAGFRSAAERIAVTRVSAAMYPVTEAESRFQRARRSDGDAEFPPRLSLLRESGVLLWRFPHDRKLAALPTLVDSAELRSSWLPQIVAGRWGEGWRIDSVRNELIGYFPDHSATVRSRLRLRSDCGRLTRIWSVFGKVRYDDSGEQIFRSMAQLVDSGASRAGIVGYARPLASYAAERVLWQEGIEAPTLDRHLSDGACDDAMWVRVARAVAGLHRTPLALPPSITRDSLQAEIQRAAATLSLAAPSSASTVDALCERLRARIGGIDCSPRATLHGDLHSKNILVGADRIHLIDLDRLGRGPALAELGSLLAELVLRDCLAGRALDWRRTAAVASAYARANESRIDKDELHWHVAAALLRERAYRCVTSLKPGRLEILPALLDAARAALDGAIVLEAP